MAEKPIHNNLALSIVICFNFLLQIPCPGQAGVKEGDLTDSLFLVRNIVKDIKKENKIEEQYRLFLRAESIYKDIKESLQDSEAKDLKKQLSIIFRRLNPPNRILSSEGINLSLKEGKNEPFYWSDPITEKMFVNYLNAVELQRKDLNRNLTPNSHSIVYDNELSKYKSRNPNQALTGPNFLIANKFAEWLSKKSNYRFMLPDENMVLASGEKRPSCWTRTIWKEKNNIRSDAWEMFGAQFYTFFIFGNRNGELPESCYPEIQLRLVTTPTTGKRLYLKTIRSEK